MRAVARQECTSMAITVLRLPTVKARTGRSRSSIYSDVKAGTFPAPIKLGPRSVGWIEAEIEAWLSLQIQHSRKAAVQR